MTDPLGPVIITAREIYDQLVRVVAAVERLADGLDGQRRDLRDHETEHQKVEADHENRLRSLERGRWPLPSATILIALAALAVAYFKP